MEERINEEGKLGKGEEMRGNRLRTDWESRNRWKETDKRRCSRGGKQIEIKAAIIAKSMIKTIFRRLLTEKYLRQLSNPLTFKNINQQPHYQFIYSQHQNQPIPSKQ